MTSLCDYSDAYILVKETITIIWNARPPVGKKEAQIQTAREKMKEI